MKWRRIADYQVTAVINRPVRETPSVKGRVNLWGESKSGLLKATILRSGENIVVVTVVRKENP